MATYQQASGRIKVSFREAAGMLYPYVKRRVMGQVKSVWLIIAYLLFFQAVVLGIPITQAGVIAVGLALVIGGLTFFMEGLLLGLMPLGEVIGVKLPQKSKLPVILAFAFLLGLGATFAEPAIGVLKAAGSTVKAWDAPLLFLVLNKHSDYLVYSVGMGVGIAVIFGMLRFLYDWSLKPFIYVLVGGLLIFSIGACLDPNLLALSGLAWDSGAVTTGPVTVPLVLALGIGICRVVGGADSDSAGGFGVVTLASLFPIIAVYALGTVLLCNMNVPAPSSPSEFFKEANLEQNAKLFPSKDALKGYAFLNADQEGQMALFQDNRGQMLAYLGRLKADDALRTEAFGPDPESLDHWAAHKGTDDQQLAVFGNQDQVRAALARYSGAGAETFNPLQILARNAMGATQAIVPLSVFFLIVLTLVLREKLPRADEICTGLLFAVVGMMLFGIGIELGLTKLGEQIGGKIPASFKRIELAQETTTIIDFDKALVQSAITSEGKQERFFYTKDGHEYVAIPFSEDQFKPATKTYTYVPRKGPLFGDEGGVMGFVVVILFAFVLGYGATLAEPALNALGITVEEVTIGTFRRSMLMQAVAIGVGVGIALGVAKIIWSIPLVWLLVPPYVVLLLLTKLSSEEYVNIGWDSAGVTTGPITVPLVLAIGLGIGSQVGVTEGFGILAMASVCPILSVLSVGLYVSRSREVAITESKKAHEAGKAS